MYIVNMGPRDGNVNSRVVARLPSPAPWKSRANFPICLFYIHDVLLNISLSRIIILSVFRMLRENSFLNNSTGIVRIC